ncbi:hypothetical protein Cgig2_027308 [Carnegiea gigantea]|uniref:Uncharacterized protein n=1 Tax=Carnegiea gigantea TaxID=171969 RepID=A0A9Q1Q8N2_9CARY|nr:hypothetical protein Cgig2_027308 [Carnegiea gigantea]
MRELGFGEETQSGDPRWEDGGHIPYAQFLLLICGCQNGFWVGILSYIFSDNQGLLLASLMLLLALAESHDLDSELASVYGFTQTKSEFKTARLRRAEARGEASVASVERSEGGKRAEARASVRLTVGREATTRRALVILKEPLKNKGEIKKKNSWTYSSMLARRQTLASPSLRTLSSASTSISASIQFFHSANHEQKEPVNVQILNALLKLLQSTPSSLPLTQWHAGWFLLKLINLQRSSFNHQELHLFNINIRLNVRNHFSLLCNLIVLFCDV